VVRPTGAGRDVVHRSENLERLDALLAETGAVKNLSRLFVTRIREKRLHLYWLSQSNASFYGGGDFGGETPSR
jgi:hypothetical protein